MLEAEAIRYGEIRGMLEAFALLTFENINVGFTFTFERLEKTDTAQATLTRHIQHMVATIELHLVPTWKVTLFNVFKEWFFRQAVFPDWYERHLFDQHIHDLVNKIDHLVHPIHVWNVEVDWNTRGGIVALSWKDMVLENEEAIYFLQFYLVD